MYSYLWGGGILFFFSNCLEKMEQYRYKYYTYSHYHSKLLKPERFLLVSYVFTYQNSYTDTTGRKPDLSSYSSLTINNITHYSRYTCYRPPITSSPSKMPSDSPLTPPLQVNCTASRPICREPTCTTTNSSTVFHINKYYSGTLISVKFSKRSSSCFGS